MSRYNVVELDWWQNVEFMGLDPHFVPVRHWSKRTLTDENQRLWGGWVLWHPAFSFYFTGDTGYSMDFADVAGVSAASTWRRSRSGPTSHAGS